MKIFTCLLLLFTLICCESNSDIDNPLPSSMKGYDLYSWQHDGGDWSYTLITGTNRNKTYEEVTALENIESKEWIKITVHNVNDLKALLKRIPKTESVGWVSQEFRISGCPLPPISIVKEIEAFANSLKLDFYVGY